MPSDDTICFHRNTTMMHNLCDCHAVQSIAIKDNDSLAAMLAANIQADLLILMSDVDGIYNKPPWEDGARMMHTYTSSDRNTIQFGTKSKVCVCVFACGACDVTDEASSGGYPSGSMHCPALCAFVCGPFGAHRLRSVLRVLWLHCTGRHRRHGLKGERRHVGTGPWR